MPAAAGCRPSRCSSINRDEGVTAAFSKAQARKLLDPPDEDTVAGLRDRAILSVGLQVGLRRAEIAALKVSDLHQNRGFDSHRVSRKGGRRDALAINPQTAAGTRAYLEASGHGADIDGPLFRPLKHNGKRQDERRDMDPDAIDRLVRKYAGELGLDRGYSAHSMRATFITTALKNGAQLEDVQKAAGHAIRVPRSCTIDADIIRKRRQAFLRLIKQMMSTTGVRSISKQIQLVSYLRSNAFGGVAGK
jgi:integrase/recombinase XerD